MANPILYFKNTINAQIWQLTYNSGSGVLGFYDTTTSRWAGYFHDTTDQLDLPVSISSTTPSTGSLVVAGGVGIGENINVSGNAGVNGTINGQTITSTAYFTGTLSVASTIKSSGSTIVVTGSGNTQFRLTNTINSQVWNFAYNAGSGVAGIYDGTGAQWACYFHDTTGQMEVPTNIASTTTTTGSLIVAGGVGIVGALNVGGNINGQTISSSASFTGTLNTAGILTSLGNTIRVGGAANTRFRLSNTTNSQLWNFEYNAGSGVSGIYDGTGSQWSCYFHDVTGQTEFPINIASTNTVTGTVIVAGGVGVAGALNIGGNVYTAGSLGVDIAVPTARLHVAGVTATAGTASLKINSGTLLSVTENGAVESDGTNLYWTDNTGTRQLLNGAAGSSNLSQAYSSGSSSANQTLALLDTKGGAFIVDGTSVSFTGAYAFRVVSSNVGTAGTQNAVQLATTFAPTSGTAAFQPLSVSYTINQTGGANGTVTGLLINATESAVVGVHNLLNLQIGSVSRYLIDRYGNTTITQAAENALAPTALTVTGGSHTAITLGTEDIGANFDFSATKQWSTGAITTQREIVFKAPTYTAVGASTITTGATLAVTGAPIASTNVTITNPYAVWVQSGTTQFDAGTFSATSGNAKCVGISGTFAPASGSCAFQALAINYTLNQVGTGITTGLLINETDTAVGSTAAYLIDAQRNGASRFTVTRYGGIIANQFASASPGAILTLTGAAQSAIATTTESINANFNFNFTKTWTVGSITTQREVVIQAPTYAASSGSTMTTGATLAITNQPTAGSNMTITHPYALWVQAGATCFVPTATVASATGAVWNGVNIGAATLTLSGSTTPITSLTLFNVAGPTISAASAVVTTDFYTGYLGAASFTGVGPASATRTWSLGLAGNIQFGGGQQVHTKDVNVAGPYTILSTDYLLHVRQTATAAITMNLPSIATVGDGWIIISVDSGYNAAANNITLARNGTDKINNVAGNYVQNVSGSSLWLVANATTSNWELI